MTYGHILAFLIGTIFGIILYYRIIPKIIWIIDACKLKKDSEKEEKFYGIYNVTRKVG